jgi:hypothetical protein
MGFENNQYEPDHVDTDHQRSHCSGIILYEKLVVVVISLIMETSNVCLNQENKQQIKDLLQRAREFDLINYLFELDSQPLKTINNYCYLSP